MSDYAFEGPKWSTSSLSWSFAAASADFSAAITGTYRATVYAAIARWAQVANLTFVETADSAAVDIRIGWSKFTGAQLGETIFSGINDAIQGQIFRPGTIVHIEDPMARPIGTALGDFYQGTAATLYQTVLHEIGHALGLAHSTNPAEIMYAALGPADPDLGPADIKGIQLLYGSPTGTVTTSASITPATINAAAAMIPVYRFFDGNTGTQFLTSSLTERNDVIATRPSLVYEGIGMGAVSPDGDPNAIPVLRFFDTGTGTHFFTASQAEKDTLMTIRPDLVPERSALYEHAIGQIGDVPVYRFFEQTDGTHFYTSSATERATIVATRPDMTFEGIAFYAPKTS